MACLVGFEASVRLPAQGLGGGGCPVKYIGLGAGGGGCKNRSVLATENMGEQGS